MSNKTDRKNEKAHQTAEYFSGAFGPVSGMLKDTGSVIRLPETKKKRRARWKVKHRKGHGNL